MTTYVFTEDAKAELRSAINYYLSEARPGTSQKFVSRVDEALETILRDPMSCPVLHGDIHRQRIWRFPYDLLFWVEHDNVTIIAVAHQSRKPERWKRRR